jgi:hypothetical protein
MARNAAALILAVKWNRWHRKSRWRNKCGRLNLCAVASGWNGEGAHADEWHRDV